MEELIAQLNDTEIVPHPRTQSGWIEVIARFDVFGKVEELISRLRRAKIARQKGAGVQASRFALLKRHIVSHSEVRHESPYSRSALKCWRK